MIKAYIDFWKRAFDFSGRSTRPDFWWAYLVNVIIITILTVFCVLIPFPNCQVKCNKDVPLIK